MQFHADARRGNIEGIRQGLSRRLPIDLFDREDGVTPLMAALERMGSAHPVKPSIETIRFLLEQEANPNLGNSLTSPMRLAVSFADIATVELLESFGANINRVSKSGYGVAVDAAYRVVRGVPGAMGMIECLAARRLSFDTVTQYGESPVSVCYHHGEMAALRRLLELGASPSPLRWSPAHESVWRARMRDDTAGLIVSEARDIWGRTPFHLAVALNSPEIMQSLCDAGADPDATIADGAGYVSAALHLAAECDAVDAIRWLVGRGATLEPPGFQSETPLHRAVEYRRLAVVELLLRHGASPEAKGEFSRNVFHAVYDRRTFLALRASANASRLNLADDCGEFPLSTAARSGDAAWVREMLVSGADAQFDNIGNTALHAAVREDAREVAQLLLEHGADPNAADVDMDRPMYSATSREMVALLLEYGANPREVNCCGSPVWESIRDPWVREFAKPH